MRPKTLVTLGVLAILYTSSGCGPEAPPPVRAPDGGMGMPTTLLIATPAGASDAGVYASKVSGASLYEGLALGVEQAADGREAAKLLEAGRADAAIMTIDDFGRARERGAALVGIGAIIQPNPKKMSAERSGRPETPYPPVILVTSEDHLRRDQVKIHTLVDVLRSGYSNVVADPEGGLGALLIYKPSLDEERERTELERLLRDGAFVPPLRLNRHELESWVSSAVRRGVLRTPIDVEEAFRFDPRSEAQRRLRWRGVQRR